MVRAMSTQPSKELETFDNPMPERGYTIRIEVPEFTCLCPKTGQPDFATLQLEYVPDRLCVELKSLKLYVWSFRDEGAFHEAVTNRILADLVGKPGFERTAAEGPAEGEEGGADGDEQEAGDDGHDDEAEGGREDGE